jgi:hypothetical protein
LFHPAVPRPFILWIHASAFTGWAIFVICQSALVRIRKVSWHRSIGWFGAGLAPVMVPLGVATAIVMARFDTIQLHQSGADAFLSVPFYDMIAFGVCIALAIYWRTKPELHRRLIFIATCGLMDAAFGRFDYLFNNNLFYPCLDLLIESSPRLDSQHLETSRASAIHSFVQAESGDVCGNIAPGRV